MLIPRYRVLLEKLAVAQIFREFPAFYGTIKFTAVFTTPNHWRISQAT
jgi:hypothetical protein